MSERSTSQALPFLEAHRELIKILGINLPTRAFLESYQPNTEWFLRPKAASGLHGTGHETRVFIWQEILSRLLIRQGIELDQEALRWAAITHDTQRMNDEYDDGHGERSARWVEERLREKLSPTTLEKVIYINRWHVPGDSRAPQMTAELKVFKDADGLDRARLGDLNPRYLRHHESKILLVNLAEELFSLSSQRQWKLKESPFAAVVNVGVILNIIRN